METEVIDIRSAAGARKFLSGLSVEGKPVTGVQTPAGRVSFADATDQQAIEFARQLADIMDPPKETQA